MKKRFFVMTTVLAILVVTCCCLVACGTKLGDIGSMTCENGSLEWTPVENATSYEITIDGNTTRTTTTNRYSIGAIVDLKEVDAFEVKLVAKNEKSSKEAYFTFSRLNTVDASNIAMNSTGSLYWTPIDGAEGYEIAVDGVKNWVTDSHYDGLPVNQKVAVQIRPQGTNRFSDYSQTKEFVRLSVPTGVTYNGEKIEWTGSLKADGYNVSINGGEPVFTRGNSLLYSSANTNFTVAIASVGDHIYSFDTEYCEAERFVYLSTPTDIRVDEEGNLLWNSIENATGYVLKIEKGNETIEETVSTTMYSNLIPAISYRIAIKPSCEGQYFSCYSDAKLVYILPAPELQWNDAIKLDGEGKKAILWNGVDQASGYSIRMTFDGEPVEVAPVSGEARSFEYAFESEGLYEIRLRALSDDSNKYDSGYSNPIYVTRLSAPTRPVENFLVSKFNNVSEGFTVTIEQVTGANGYAIYKDGVLIEGEKIAGMSNQFGIRQVVSADEVNQQNVNYSIKSLGILRSDNVAGKSCPHAYLESLTSLDFQITVLAVPTDINIAGYTLSWGAISDANGYNMKLSGTSIAAETTEYSLSALGAGTHEISVCSCGNGSNVLASNYSAIKKVIRLSKVTDIKILTEGQNEGKLTFTPVEGAKSYNVTLNAETTPIDSSEYDSMNRHILTTGTTIHIVAVNNTWDDPDAKNVYTMNSVSSDTQKIYKLATPTFPTTAFTNTEFSWCVPSNANTNVYSPKYYVYNADKKRYSGEFNAPNMDISQFTGGQYKFYVRAIGDGKNFVNSEYSEVIAIDKLETPAVTLSDGKYCWKKVAGTKSYIVKINGVTKGQIAQSDEKEYSFNPNFNEVNSKGISVEIVALGDGGHETIDSAPYTVLQKTVKLVKPTIKSIGYTEESVSNTGKIYVEVDHAVEHAGGYIYNIGGVRNESEALRFEYAPKSTGDYAITVASKGSVFDEEGIYYIDSDPEGGQDTHLWLLSAPEFYSVGLTMDGEIEWGTSKNAIGYEVQIAPDSEVNFLEETYKFSASETSFAYDWKYMDGKEEKEVESFIVVEVRALGDGVKTITSEWMRSGDLMK